MHPLHTTPHVAELAKPLGAEDLRPGDFVAVLHEVHEYPSFLWCCDALTLPPDALVRLRWRGQESGLPLKVVAVCLPFVLVKTVDGRCETRDVRQCQFVRLSDRYARKAWKGLKPRKKKSRR